MKTQYDRLGAMLQSARGCTAVDIMRNLPSTCPHKRLSDLQAKGWTIRKVKDGKLLRYFGKPPKSQYVPKTVWVK